MKYIVLHIPDTTTLRDHLDGLNEAGTTPVAVGLDSNSQPFLITLVGPYVESEHVLFDSPWQGEVDYVNAVVHCDDCNGAHNLIDHLKYPVALLVGVTK